MPDVTIVADAAVRLNKEKPDNVALETLIGLRAKKIEQDSSLEDNVDFEPKYESQTMGGIDEVRALGKRIANRWNKELYGLVCTNKGNDDKDRKALIDSLNLGEAAVIAAVAGALLTLGVAAAIAAALAPLLVRTFIWPAKDELCEAWGESVNH